MELKSLKELDKLMLLCRKRGVKAIKIDNIEFTIEIDEPVHSHIASALPEIYTPGGISESTKIETPDILTDEQLLFYSAGTNQ